MCLAYPGKVIKLMNDYAIVDYITEKRKVSTALLKPKENDYVLVNAGFIIQVIPEHEALESIKAWQKQLTLADTITKQNKK